MADKEPKCELSEIERLRKENESFRQDPLWKMFFALVRKSNELADDLNSFEVSITKEDKTFDRFLKLMEKIEPFQATIARLRQDYLKIPEDEVAEAEKKGIPRIEQIAQKRKQR